MDTKQAKVEVLKTDEDVRRALEQNRRHLDFRAGNVETRLIKKMLELRNSKPGNVMFPKGDMRYL